MTGAEPDQARGRSLGMKTITIVTLVAAIALAGPAMAKRKSRPHPQAQQGQIACTVTGCQRIPPNCHPEMGYTPWGIPTGFDIVVCRR